MKKRIHINQHKIRSNNKALSAGAKGYDELEPVITCKTYKSNDYGFEAVISGESRVIYSPNNPLPCGAKVWIETDSEVIVIDKGNTLHAKTLKQAGFTVIP